MSVKSPVGSGNLLEIWSLDASGNFEDLKFSFDKTVQSSIKGHPLKENLAIDIQSKIRNEALETFYRSYLTAAKVESSQVDYEDSSYDTLVSGVDAAIKFGFIWYNGELDSKRELILGRGILSGDTGNHTTQNKNVGDSPVSITCIDGQQVVCGSNKFNSNKVTASADITVLTAQFGSVRYETSV